MLIKLAQATIPTEWGDFLVMAYANGQEDQMPHLCLVRKNTDFNSEVLVRIHSECITGDLFHSERCDCGKQLNISLSKIGKAGGVLIYLRQEGRGIGIINKLRAYNKQDEGLDTIEANQILGFEIDERDYSIAKEILLELGVKSIRLLTNNPLKVEAFSDQLIKVVERIPILSPVTKNNENYLRTKQNSLGHMLNIPIG